MNSAILGMFEAADVASLTSNYNTMLLGFVTLGVVTLGFVAVTAALKKGRRSTN